MPTHFMGLYLRLRLAIYGIYCFLWTHVPAETNDLPLRQDGRRGKFTYFRDPECPRCMTGLFVHQLRYTRLPDPAIQRDTQRMKAVIHAITMYRLNPMIVATPIT